MTNQTSASIGVFEDPDFGGVRIISQVPGFQKTLPFTGSYLQDYLPNIQLSDPRSKFGPSSNFIVPRATELDDTVTSLVTKLDAQTYRPTMNAHPQGTRAYPY